MDAMCKSDAHEVDGPGVGVCNREDEGRIRLSNNPQFVCPGCGAEDFTPGKLAVCLRDFDGAICQRCGTIVTPGANAAFCKQAESLIDDVIAKRSRKSSKDSK